MASAHLPPRNGWNELTLSTEPGLWGPLKGLEEETNLLRCVGPGVSFYAFIPSVANVDERELCLISLLRAQCFLLQERKKEAETEREESKADAEVDVVLLKFLPRRIGKQCQLADLRSQQ